MDGGGDGMIGSIEQGIVDRLTAASESGGLGYAFKKVDSYGGDLDAAVDRIIRDTPAALVISKGLTVVQTARTRVKLRAGFGVLCCARSLRNEKAARNGTPLGGVGSYQLIEDVTSLLIFQTFGLAINPLALTGVVPVANDRLDGKLLSIYSVEVETFYSITVPDITGDLNDFTTFNVNWDVPVLGNVSTELPADDTADATDKIILPT
ncbi:MAG: DUF1834 family protein [Alphaproteobacteria bacterium]|nr:DUF1834 family protein [Alphaproteobacteria bacterium]